MPDGRRKKNSRLIYLSRYTVLMLNGKYVDKLVGNAVYIDDESFPVSRKFKPVVLDQFLFPETPKDKIIRKVIFKEIPTKNEQINLQ